MKILFISNLYPPYDVGGYEQLCRDVVDGMTRKGHDCHVLTSDYGVTDKPVSDDRVYRLLKLSTKLRSKWPNVSENANRNKHNNKVVFDILHDLNPDVVFVWNCVYLYKSMLLLIEKLHDKVIYYISDTWPIYKYDISIKYLIAEFFDCRNYFSKPKYKNAIFSCQYIKSIVTQRINVQNYIVVYNSVNLEPYLDIKRDNFNSRTILFIGRLCKEKGVHILIRAFAYARSCSDDMLNVRLTIVGEGNATYYRRLIRMVKSEDIADSVTFLGNVNREKLAELLREHALFVFPSIWEEPFSLTLILALASGIPVIATQTGGSKEILNPASNCFTYTPLNHKELALRMIELMNNSSEGERLGAQGRKDANEYSITNMINNIERILRQLYRGQQIQ